MISKINFENYKAFKSGQIEIKPITLLLGANSVGKSAIAQLFLMLQQTNEVSYQNYKSALKLYGGLINLGEADNLFKDRKIDQDLGIGFDIESQNIKKQFQSELFERFLAYFIEIGHSIRLSKKSDRKWKWYNPFSPSDENYFEMESSIDTFKDFNYFKEYLEYLSSAIEEIQNLILKEKKIDDAKIQGGKFYYRTIWHNRFPNITINKESTDEILLTFSMLKKLTELPLNSSFKIKYNLSIFEDKFYIKQIVLSSNEKTLIKIGTEKFDGKDYKVYLETILFDKKKINKKLLLKLKLVFKPDNTLFTAMSKEKIESESKIPNSPISSVFAFSIFRIFNQYQKYLKSNLSSENINYVSPLRAHPKRYYMLDKAKYNVTLDTLDGDSLAEILKENNEVRIKVNNWLEKFDLNVRVEIFKEVIHKLKIGQNNLSLDITDVGFGISQVLPVIIQGFLSEKRSLTIIEQPEIHLHPKMQADLADLYIDISNGGDKYLLVETHSEYFLKRLRRRISEGIIDYKDVKIYLLHPNENSSGSYIEDLNIEEGGRFKYPKDYYSGELLKDSTEFMKMQIRKSH